MDMTTENKNLLFSLIKKMESGEIRLMKESSRDEELWLEDTKSGEKIIIGSLDITDGGHMWLVDIRPFEEIEEADANDYFKEQFRKKEECSYAECLYHKQKKTK
jgi:hypothetical protein